MLSIRKIDGILKEVGREFCSLKNGVDEKTDESDTGGLGILGIFKIMN